MKLVFFRISSSVKKKWYPFWRGKKRNVLSFAFEYLLQTVTIVCVHVGELVIFFCYGHSRLFRIAIIGNVYAREVFKIEISFQSEKHDLV